MTIEKTIDTNGSTSTNHWKTIDTNGRHVKNHRKTIDTNGWHVKNHWQQWFTSKQNHWKTIDHNGFLTKNIAIPSCSKIYHRRGLARDILQSCSAVFSAPFPCWPRRCNGTAHTFVSSMHFVLKNFLFVSLCLCICVSVFVFVCFCLSPRCSLLWKTSCLFLCVVCIYLCLCTCVFVFQSLCLCVFCVFVFVF